MLSQRRFPKEERKNQRKEKETKQNYIIESITINLTIALVSYLIVMKEKSVFTSGPTWVL